MYQTFTHEPRHKRPTCLHEESRESSEESSSSEEEVSSERYTNGVEDSVESQNSGDSPSPGREWSDEESCTRFNKPEKFIMVPYIGTTHVLKHDKITQKNLLSPFPSFLIPPVHKEISGPPNYRVSSVRPVWENQREPKSEKRELGKIRNSRTEETTSHGISQNKNERKERKTCYRHYPPQTTHTERVVSYLHNSKKLTSSGKSTSIPENFSKPSTQKISTPHRPKSYSRERGVNHQVIRPTPQIQEPQRRQPVILSENDSMSRDAAINKTVNDGKRASKKVAEVKEKLVYVVEEAGKDATKLETDLFTLNEILAIKKDLLELSEFAKKLKKLKEIKKESDMEKSRGTSCHCKPTDELLRDVNRRVEALEARQEELEGGNKGDTEIESKQTISEKTSLGSQPKAPVTIETSAVMMAPCFPKTGTILTRAEGFASNSEMVNELMDLKTQIQKIEKKRVSNASHDEIVPKPESKPPTVNDHAIAVFSSKTYILTRESYGKKAEVTNLKGEDRREQGEKGKNYYFCVEEKTKSEVTNENVTNWLKSVSLEERQDGVGVFLSKEKLKKEEEEEEEEEALQVNEVTDFVSRNSAQVLKVENFKNQACRVSEKHARGDVNFAYLMTSQNESSAKEVTQCVEYKKCLVSPSGRVFALVGNPDEKIVRGLPPESTAKGPAESIPGQSPPKALRQSKSNCSIPSAILAKQQVRKLKAQMCKVTSGKVKVSQSKSEQQLSFGSTVGQGARNANLKIFGKMGLRGTGKNKQHKEDKKSKYVKRLEAQLVSLKKNFRKYEASSPSSTYSEFLASVNLDSEKHSTTVDLNLNNPPKFITFPSSTKKDMKPSEKCKMEESKERKELKKKNKEDCKRKEKEVKEEKKCETTREQRRQKGKKEQEKKEEKRGSQEQNPKCPPSPYPFTPEPECLPAPLPAIRRILSPPRAPYCPPGSSPSRPPIRLIKPKLKQQLHRNIPDICPCPKYSKTQDFSSKCTNDSKSQSKYDKNGEFESVLEKTSSSTRYQPKSVDSLNLYRRKQFQKSKQQKQEGKSDLCNCMLKNLLKNVGLLNPKLSKTSLTPIAAEYYYKKNTHRGCNTESATNTENDDDDDDDDDDDEDDDEDDDDDDDDDEEEKLKEGESYSFYKYHGQKCHGSHHHRSTTPRCTHLKTSRCTRNTTQKKCVTRETVHEPSDVYTTSASGRTTGSYKSYKDGFLFPKTKHNIYYSTEKHTQQFNRIHKEKPKDQKICSCNNCGNVHNTDEKNQKTCCESQNDTKTPLEAYNIQPERQPKMTAPEKISGDPFPLFSFLSHFCKNKPPKSKSSKSALEKIPEVPYIKTYPKIQKTRKTSNSSKNITLKRDCEDMRCLCIPKIQNIEERLGQLEKNKQEKSPEYSSDLEITDCKPKEKNSKRKKHHGHYTPTESSTSHNKREKHKKKKKWKECCCEGCECRCKESKTESKTSLEQCEENSRKKGKKERKECYRKCREACRGDKKERKKKRKKRKKYCDCDEKKDFDENCEEDNKKKKKQKKRKKYCYCNESFGESCEEEEKKKKHKKKKKRKKYCDCYETKKSSGSSCEEEKRKKKKRTKKDKKYCHCEEDPCRPQRETVAYYHMVPSRDYAPEKTSSEQKNSSTSKDQLYKTIIQGRLCSIHSFWKTLRNNRMKNVASRTENFAEQKLVREQPGDLFVYDSRGKVFKPRTKQLKEESSSLIRKLKELSRRVKRQGEQDKEEKQTKDNNLKLRESVS